MRDQDGWANVLGMVMAVCALGLAACGGVGRARDGGAADVAVVPPGPDASAAIDGGLVAQWARTVVAAPAAASEFAAAAADRAGNVYVTGVLGKATFDFGNGVTATGINDVSSALLVKYDASGRAGWATANGAASFGRLALDSTGNLYVLARLPYTPAGLIDFGNGVTVLQADDRSPAALVKYSPDGAALWAQILPAGSGLALDFADNIYVGGTVADPVTYDASASVSTGDGRKSRIRSPAPQPVDPAHALLAKYDAAGVVKWTRTVAAGTVTGDSPHSAFGQVAVDPAGNVYVSGTIGSALGRGTYDFGDDTTATGPSSVLAKYDNAGTVQWLRAWPWSSWPYGIYWYSLVTDAAGSVYGAGQTSCRTYDFGNGVVVTGSGQSQGTAGPACAILVKHDRSGIAEWAASSTGSGFDSYFTALALDSRGNLYATGSVSGQGTYDFGNGARVTAAGRGQNYLVLVKYSFSGTTQWARSSEHEGSIGDELTSVAVDATDEVYVAGVVAGPGAIDFGDGISLTGLADVPNLGWNGLLLKYR